MCDIQFIHHDVEGFVGFTIYLSIQGEGKTTSFTSLICQYILTEVWHSEKQKQRFDSTVLVKLVHTSCLTCIPGGFYSIFIIQPFDQQGDMIFFTYRPPRGLINPVDVLDTQFYTLSSAEVPKFQYLYTFGLKCLAQAHNHKKIHSCSTNTLFC